MPAGRLLWIALASVLLAPAASDGAVAGRVNADGSPEVAGSGPAVDGEAVDGQRQAGGDEKEHDVEAAAAEESESELDAAGDLRLQDCAPNCHFQLVLALPLAAASFCAFSVVCGWKLGSRFNVCFEKIVGRSLFNEPEQPSGSIWEGVPPGMMMPEQAPPPMPTLFGVPLGKELFDVLCPPTMGPGKEEQEEAAEEPVCVVCLLDIEHGEQRRQLDCGHSYHCECIDGWWCHQRSLALQCPLCKRPQNRLCQARFPRAIFVHPRQHLGATVFVAVESPIPARGGANQMTTVV